MEALELKISQLEESLETIEAASSPCPSKEKACKQCGKTFAKNFELEAHMVSFHGCEKQHSCEVSGKEFYLKWRLEKHFSLHENSVKLCKYFKERTACQFLGPETDP